MAANPVHRLTVEEFRQLPAPVGDFDYELRDGKLFRVTRPKLKHYLLQTRLRDLLHEVMPTGGFVGYEFAFRIFPEFDLRVADVAYVSPERWSQADPEDNLRGAPELVIEILSPSNTEAEMYEKEQLCLAYGGLEFWVVDPEKHTIRIAQANGPTLTYGEGQLVPLRLFAGELRVDEVFK